MNDRQDKRESAKKSREFSVYSKKAVRAKEALLNKKGLGAKSPVTQTPKAQTQ
jgi:hypothetical protein